MKQDCDFVSNQAIDRINETNTIVKMWDSDEKEMVLNDVTVFLWFSFIIYLR